MGALTIAFDVIIVGALALPWVLLVIHLFFFEGENRLGEILGWMTAQGRQAAAGVLVFAMTYTLGSAVSRIAQDFFNDDDLQLQVGGVLLRHVVTDDRIRARFYCDASDDDLNRWGAGNPALAGRIKDFELFRSGSGCRTLKGFWSRRMYVKVEDSNFTGTAADIFGLQENALMAKGGDFTVRLRQLHDQIMVLRGAAFNGVIGFSLCLFAWGAMLKRKKPSSWTRWAFVSTPAFYFVVGMIAVMHHFSGGFPPDPPYLEFTLFLLTGAGAWLLWWPEKPKPASLLKPEEARAEETKETPAGKETEAECFWHIEHWARLVLLSAILTTTAGLGWWSTELLYTQQVIYSYDSQVTAAQK